jgi:glutamate-1-semialdehyde 2,1-aminomutase
LLDDLYARGEHLRSRIGDLLARCGLPLCVSGMGSLMTIHTVTGPVHSPADLAEADPVLKELLFHELVERGIYLAPRGYIAMSTMIDDADCDRFVEALGDATQALAAVTAEG